MFDLQNKKIFVAGHKGMVGAAVCRRLETEACEVIVATRAELDLTDQEKVNVFIENQRPDAVIICAAKVGGIYANSTMPVDFLENNLALQNNLIKASATYNVEKLVFLGSSCIYPKMAPQPIKEDYLLTGALEPTNEWYAIAKIAGLKLCAAYRQQFGHNFISVMPTNLYGPGDNYDLQTSHVVPALIRKIHNAKMENAPSVEIWGTGKPRREFLHVDDCADGIVFALSHYDEAQHLNIGCGSDISIYELAQKIAQVIGYKGRFIFNDAYPDGTPRKLLDVSKIANLGWQANISLDDGLRATYNSFLQSSFV